ncbi:PP2C family protein-serine/threonine phosphatase [Ureibacillus chungkukjangi]|uniref:Sigma-B regulation protein RsbU (Phosphoserine phosphatase) n=1 Tax=Ureibacillus chungkukjangi TaxID=1202712 RepID=A0A318TC72_9BACL|nr:PP2C family protein-serine/threonine phosphatase [Ureibacillus chungkukjangi]MCM3389742.1 PP2C family protein-serine/threonine phosphatase [Ureibacillus chungkukjangi]PYF02206.1 sigma-B regulation protein RsbU (phosphoserine phosphatase) [Ureibacillus chungkukjangi]
MEQIRKQYKKILSDYIGNQSESDLYIGQNFIKRMIQKNVTPEEVISIHKQVLEEIYDDIPQTVLHGYDFLIEVMVHFGLKVQEHQALLAKQEELRIEMDIATKIQNLLLETEIPNPPSIDIGMLSIPLRKMNGDYVHFMHDKGRYLSAAVTDVVGKGVPAALCMSMVKYGLDTLEYANSNPSYVLEVLNRIIEKSIDDSMFVSLCYLRYNLKTDVLTWSSAGHEPSLYYNAEKEEFYDLESKGLLLGILPETKYTQQDIQLRDGDLVIVMTDGVTDFRNKEEFDSREIIKELALANRHLTAQEMCETIHKALQKLHDFKLEDDFTLVIIKK